MRRILQVGGALLAAALAVGCAAGTGGSRVAAQDGAQQTAVEPIGAEPLVLPEGTLDADGRIGALRWAGGLRLTGFGGISSIDVSPDGSRLVMLSDRTFTATVAPRYDGAGTLVGLETLRRGRLLDASGAPYPNGFNDSEGMAMLPMGWRVVSFEYHHRLMVFDPGLMREEGEIPLPRDADLARNEGIEAITETADGRLVLLSERNAAGVAGLHQGWIGDRDGWESFTYRTRPGYRPTAAALLPDGDLVVLERRDPFLATIGGAVMHVPIATIEPGATVEGRPLAELGGGAFGDNYEAISAWRDGEGRTRILVASDDNMLFLLRTVLLQFVWDR